MPLNEFNTFSKLIYPYLEKELGYPRRKSQFFDEQTYVRKRGNKKGPYDGAFKNDSGIILLVEAKSETRKLSKTDRSQLFDYCLGESFPIPPPYALLSNGRDFQWYKRLKDRRSGEFSYTPCDEILWSKALKQKGSGLLTEQLTLKQVIRLLKIVREKIFDDLTNNYFSEGYIFSTSKLGTRKIKFEKVLETRKSFVDPKLEKATEEVTIRSVLSSIALSLTLKLLFIKIITDRQNDPFPTDPKKEFKKYAENFPGILKVEPYDVLEFSDNCEKSLVEFMSSVSITQALVFEDRNNPIGDIWDGLVKSEELDLQVKSLGNVYTPPVIVNAMVDRAEKALCRWKSKKVLEPACGSGHFVREIYKRMHNSYLGKRGNKEKIIEAHLKTISHIKAIDIDPFAVQTTQLGMFLELHKTQGLWKAIAPNGYFDFSKVVTSGDFLDNSFFRNNDYTPDLIIGNPPYGVKVTKEIEKTFDVGSNDSYGCFISKSIKVLANSGKLLFIVSSTFLTNRRHINLRKQIFNNSLIESIYTLHRNVFANRDVFCCIFDITKRTTDKEINDHLYHFYDAWPIHPSKPEFLIALKAWSKDISHTLPKELLEDYSFPQILMNLRLMPPKPREVENKLSDDHLGVDIDLSSHENHIFPIVSGLPSLYLFCADKEYKNYIRKKNIKFPEIGNIKGLEVKRDQKWVPIIKLWQVAQVKQGLATADDKYFLRKTPGVIPNPRRRYIKDVDLRCVIDQNEISSLTIEEKENGIKVLDRKREKYFVPFDKGGEQNTEKGELRLFWSPVDYWIDWSKQSVNLLKKRASYPQRTPKKPNFSNKKYYFRSEIRFSRAGLYSSMPHFSVNFS